MYQIIELVCCALLVTLEASSSDATSLGHSNDEQVVPLGTSHSNRDAHVFDHTDPKVREPYTKKSLLY